MASHRREPARRLNPILKTAMTDNGHVVQLNTAFVEAVRVIFTARMSRVRRSALVGAMMKELRQHNNLVKWNEAAVNEALYYLAEQGKITLPEFVNNEGARRRRTARRPGATTGTVLARA